MAFNYNFQLDYIFFFYGLSFLILAAVCFSLKQDIIKLPFIWLGLFGLSHGLNEWLDLLAITFSDCNLFFAIRTCVMALSFIFLFEFARRLRYYLFKRTYGLWVYIFLLGMAFSGLLYGLKSINVTMRYFLAIPAGFLSSWALYKESSNSLKKTPILVVSVSLALYGIASGFIVPKSDMVPSCWINHDSFSGAFGFPVQLLRGFLAACMAFSIWIYSKRLSKTKHTDMRGYFIIAFILLFIISVGWILAVKNFADFQS